MTLTDLLERVTTILDGVSIPYMLTGSLAAAYYATPRATQDIDLVVEATSDQLEILTDLLSSAGLYVSSTAAREAFLHEGQFNAIDPGTGWKVGFIIRKSRAFSVSEFGRRKTRTVLGLELSLTSRKDLVLAKLEWAKKGESEVQLRDVQAVLRAASSRFDWAYVEHWVRELGLREQWEVVQRDNDSRSDGSPSA